MRAFLALLFLSAGFAGAAGDGGKSPVSAWWNGSQATGEWLGARPALAARGLTFDGHWRGIYFGILDSESGGANAFAEELCLAFELDAAEATGWQGLRGLSAFVEGRWRDPGPDANPNTYVEAEALFNPSRYNGGVGWRFMNAGLSYTAKEFLGVEEGLSVKGGWVQPQKEFITQPLARLFANNAMASAEGLGGNIPYGSSFSTWGGVVEVKPVDRAYLKTGLYMSYFNPTDPENRGLRFRGDPDKGNGLFFLGETGVTPELGAARLPGHYALGGYLYGESSDEYGGNKYGFYAQADQMLWREKQDQGLRMFSLWYFAPGYDNEFAFYAHGGLVYQGLIPCRDRDELVAGAVFGQYGEGAAGSKSPAPTQSVLLEAGYRVRLGGWGFVQPFGQYLVQPAGTTAVANAATLGVFLGVDF